jgi:hypothetical protein
MLERGITVQYRQELVGAAVELLDIVVLVHAPRPLTLTREHVRSTLNYLDCRAIATACILCMCNGNTVDGLIGCCIACCNFQTVC